MRPIPPWFHVRVGGASGENVRLTEYWLRSMPRFFRRVRDTSMIVTSIRTSAFGLSAASMMFLIRPSIGADARTTIALALLFCVTIGRLPVLVVVSI